LPCKACLSVTVAIRAMVVGGTRRGHLPPNVVDHVEFGSQLYTDAHTAYVGLES